MGINFTNLQIVMQIAVKAAEGRTKDASEVISRAVRRTLPDASVSVRQLFPDAPTGNRARLFVVEVPDHLPPTDVAQVVAALNDEAAIEYASIPSPRSVAKD